MSAMVRIPTPLRRITKGQDKVSVEGQNLNDVIASLDAQFPGIRERLCDEQGELRNFVNLYVNGEDVRFLDGLNTATNPGDEISVVPAGASDCSVRISTSSGGQTRVDEETIRRLHERIDVHVHTPATDIPWEPAL